MTETTLLEPSIADMLKAIDTATALPASKKTHWSCSLRQICAYLNRPPEIVPARWSGIKNAIYELHAARVGANPKTLANHKSNVRAALLWFAEEKSLPKSGAPLMPAWAALMGKVVDPNRRKRLSGLVRYCSAAKIVPEHVNEEVLDKYMSYRGETTRLAANKAARQRDRPRLECLRGGNQGMAQAASDRTTGQAAHGDAMGQFPGNPERGNRALPHRLQEDPKRRAW